MGWNIRPFVGTPGEPVRFFRNGSWENAYVVVARMIWASSPDEPLAQRRFLPPGRSPSALGASRSPKRVTT